MQILIIWLPVCCCDSGLPMMNAKIIFRDQTPRRRIPRYGSVMNVSVKFTVFAVFIDALFVSVVNFRFFVVWNKPKNIG